MWYTNSEGGADPRIAGDLDEKIEVRLSDDMSNLVS